MKRTRRDNDDDNGGRLFRSLRWSWPFLTAIVVIAIAWGKYGKQVEQNTSDNVRQDGVFEIMSTCVNNNTNTLGKVETRLESIDGRVERMDSRQMTFHKESKESFEKVLKAVQKKLEPEPGS